MSDYKLNNVINCVDALFRTSTRCDICDEEFETDGHHICPKCREAVLKVRKDIYYAQNCIPSDGGRVVCGIVNTGGVAKDTVFNITDGISRY